MELNSERRAMGVSSANILVYQSIPGCSNCKEVSYAGIPPELYEKMNTMFCSVVSFRDYACPSNSWSLARDSIDGRGMFEGDNDVVEISGNVIPTNPPVSSQATKRQKKGKKKASLSALNEFVESLKAID
ncbi:hypothetical protein KSP39_PZI003963 [Platanthera zijinensis]|uniref:Uncharacterized protein n=1 Tax=Platanthera zijinensis TaxID=2320716 RepID=A0AAP0BVK0_9ASPA